jgi:hypothetical protein
MLVPERQYGCENRVSVRLGVIVNAMAANISSKVRTCTYKIVVGKSEQIDLFEGLDADGRTVLRLVYVSLK